MDQEHLTPAEQNQLRQDFLSTPQAGENTEMGGGEKAKTLEGHLEGHKKGYQQQDVAASGALAGGGRPQEIEGSAGDDAPPDPQKDFMGYMQWLGKTLHQQGLLQDKQQYNSAVPEAQQLYSFYQKSVSAVKQKHHDFDQAADFIYDMRAQQLAAVASLYPEMADPKVIDEVIGNELKQMLRDCAQKNQNPAEVIYEIAQKIGYTSPQSSTVENLQERHHSARTLAAYNGLTPGGPISLDMLDKMSEAEFSTWIIDPKNKAAFNRLMGGGDL
ncbi:Uncharacterised protein [Candidatus Bartonella washoeensis]|uniref:Phage protein n=1 Tax=Candidatus Bartonella washoeensis Sb944nv TaxID=1094563 RepID=J1IZP1_9HYPH|nr:hypothetical protein [Bartonella washoeensis]EJF76805.1 hypothetical protein MCQ_01668 [Bartonella washoeensis Sb944nv]SPU27942.1 Uncharacterised protein [Bartonella washoeensis]